MHQGAELRFSLQPKPRHGRIKLATPLAGAAHEGRAGTAPSAQRPAGEAAAPALPGEPRSGRAALPAPQCRTGRRLRPRSDPRPPPEGERRGQGGAGSRRLPAPRPTCEQQCGPWPRRAAPHGSPLRRHRRRLLPPPPPHPPPAGPPPPPRLAPRQPQHPPLPSPPLPASPRPAPLRAGPEQRGGEAAAAPGGAARCLPPPPPQAAGAMLGGGGRWARAGCGRARLVLRCECIDSESLHFSKIVFFFTCKCDVFFFS